MSFTNFKSDVIVCLCQLNNMIYSSFFSIHSYFEQFYFLRLLKYKNWTLLNSSTLTDEILSIISSPVNWMFPTHAIRDISYYCTDYVIEINGNNSKNIPNTILIILSYLNFVLFYRHLSYSILSPIIKFDFLYRSLSYLFFFYFIFSLTYFSWFHDDQSTWRSDAVHTDSKKKRTGYRISCC